MKSLFWKSFLFLMPVLLFGQMFEHKTDLSGYSGLQLPEFDATGKGSRTNEMYYLNPILYFRTKYLIKDDEILGYIRGRVTKEEPLSSVTMNQLNEIRSPQAQLSNLAQIHPQYQDAANNHELFLRIFEESLQKVIEAQQTGNADNYNENDEYNYEADYSDTDYTGETDEATDYVPGTTPIPEGYLQSMRNQAPLLRAQSMTKDLNIPTLEEALKDTSKSFEEKELEFVIRYEQLNRAYSNTVAEYYKVLDAKNLVEKRFSFNPADNTETFRVFIYGIDVPTMLWSKSFSLDGTGNYQSYNDTVWFLGYEVPLNKTDLRALVPVFTRNKKIGLRVVGKGGEVSFDLSDIQIAAMKQLFSDYALGKMVVPSVESAVESSPLLR